MAITNEIEYNYVVKKRNNLKVQEKAMALKAIIVYIIIISIIAFMSMGIDKAKAKRGDFRIPEKTLFILAIIGGSIGSILGMQLFRHKTKHWYFVWGMPVILVLQITLAVAIYIKYIH